MSQTHGGGSRGIHGGGEEVGSSELIAGVDGSEQRSLTHAYSVEELLTDDSSVGSDLYTSTHHRLVAENS